MSIASEVQPLSEWILGLTREDIQTLADIASVLATIGAAFLVIVELRHSATANFISAWNDIDDRLQDNGPVWTGRTIARAFRKHPPTEWPSVFVSLERLYGSQEWYRSLRDGFERCTGSESRLEFLRGLVLPAYRAFDLVGTITVHSRVPGLLQVVVTEYMDSILATWECGEEFLARRYHDEKRRELFHSFSVLYQYALRLEGKFPAQSLGTYPFQWPSVPGLQWFRFYRACSMAANDRNRRVLKRFPLQAA